MLIEFRIERDFLDVARDPRGRGMPDKIESFRIVSTCAQ